MTVPPPPAGIIPVLLGALIFTAIINAFVNNWF
jgi:hypothetical protein